MKCDNLSYKRGLGRNRCLAKKHNLQILAETFPVPISRVATNRDTDERIERRGDDPYKLACELAEAVGIDIEDG